MKQLILLLTVGAGSICLFDSCKPERKLMSNQEFITIASSNNNLEMMAAEQAIAKGKNVYKQYAPGT